MPKNLYYSVGLQDDIAADFKTRMDGAFLKLFDNSGGIPVNAEAAELGNLLVTYSLNGLGVTGMTLNAATIANGTISRDATQNISGTGVANGNAAYYRLVLPSDTGVLSTTQPRCQGLVGTSGSDFNIGSVAISIGVTYTLGQFSQTIVKNGI